MNNDLNSFIDKLASTKNMVNVVNQYSYDSVHNEVRRNNLSIYLNQMIKINPQILLVGEAPGYNGCRFSGVPFTSEYILKKNTSLFGMGRGYKKTQENNRIKKEQSATIVWETINDLKIIPLLWNAFPFHPHRPNIVNKNRTPSITELEIGLSFLKEIINIFNIETIIAVGNNADRSISNINLEHKKVRHPSNGGKQDFVKGISTIIEIL